MENLENLIKNSLIFLVTDKKLDRSAWKRAMNSLGVHPENIKCFESFADAICALEEKSPSVLVTSAEVKDQSASELLQAFRARSQNRSLDLLAVMADVSDGMLELEALESEADVLLVKPYAANDLKKAFENALQTKVCLEPIEKKIHKGFSLLLDDLSRAEKVVAKLEERHSKRELFVRLKAALLSKKGDHGEEARLLKETNSQSYQVLAQCFDAFIKDNNPAGAFEMASKILEKWPFHPKRISNYIKVCILTSNYHSLVEFALTHLPTCSPENERAIAAGLAICSSSIGRADKPIAIKAGTLAVKHGGNNWAIVDKALKALLELNQVKIVKRLSNELAEYESLAEALAVTDYRLLELEGSEPFTLFKAGMELTNKGVKDFYVFEILLKSAKRAGRKRESLDELAEDASKQYPEKKAYFKSLVA